MSADHATLSCKSRDLQPDDTKVTILKKSPKVVKDCKGRRLRVDYSKRVLLVVSANGDSINLAMRSLDWGSPENPVQVTQNNLLRYGLRVKAGVREAAEKLKAQVLADPKLQQKMADGGLTAADLRVYGCIYFGKGHRQDDGWKSRYAIKAGRFQNGQPRLVGAGDDCLVGPAGLANLVVPSLLRHGCIQFSGRKKAATKLQSVAVANFGELSPFVNCAAGPEVEDPRWYARFCMDDAQDGQALLIKVDMNYFNAHTNSVYYVLDQRGAPMSGYRLVVPSVEDLVFRLAGELFDDVNRQDLVPKLVARYADLYAHQYNMHVSLIKMTVEHNLTSQEQFCTLLMSLADKVKQVQKPEPGTGLPSAVAGLSNALLMQISGERAFRLDQQGQRQMEAVHDSELGRKIISQIIEKHYASAASVAAVSVLKPKSKFQPGSQVRLKGLAAKKFNGLVGEVVYFDEARGRYGVTVQLPGESPKTRALKPANLETPIATTVVATTS